MKTFDDLKFTPKSSALRPGGLIAKMNFKNGYGVSVINDGYGDVEGLYELAVLHDGLLCYTTHITNDVIGWLNPHEVTEKMKLVQELKGEICPTQTESE